MGFRPGSVFKKVFYLEVLQELKARGKTIVVISHEDRYFQLADRIIRLEFGKVEYETSFEQEVGLKGFADFSGGRIP